MSKIAAIRETIHSAIGGVVGIAHKVLDVNSPSRVFKALGAATMIGLSHGVVANQDSPLNAVMDVSQKITKAGAGISIDHGRALDSMMRASKDITKPGAGVSIDNGRALAANLDTRPPLRTSGAGRGVSGAEGGMVVNLTINVTSASSPDDIARVVTQQLAQIQAGNAARKRSRLADSD